MNKFKRWLKSRSDYWDIYFVLACVFAVIMCLGISHGGWSIGFFGCARIDVKKSDTDITKTISCPIADDINCQKCHDFKIVSAPWHDAKNVMHYFELILPETIEIDFEKCTHIVLVNSGFNYKDWVWKNVFAELEDNIWTFHLIYYKQSDFNTPPDTILCLIRVISANPLDKNVSADKLFWIYKNGIPIEVTEKEIDLFILGFSGEET